MNADCDPQRLASPPFASSGLFPLADGDVFPAIFNAAEIAPSWFVTRAAPAPLGCRGSRRQGRDEAVGGPWEGSAFPPLNPFRKEEEPEGQSCHPHPGWLDGQPSTEALPCCRTGSGSGTGHKRDIFIPCPFSRDRQVKKGHFHPVPSQESQESAPKPGMQPQAVPSVKPRRKARGLRAWVFGGCHRGDITKPTRGDKTKPPEVSL